MRRTRVGLVDWIDPLIGTDGEDPTEYGGMVPATAPPFAMTRWTPMTRENGISRCAFHRRDERIIGFLGSRQPAIWMGDWGSVAVMPGVGDVRVTAAERGLALDRGSEESTAACYRADLVTGAGTRIATRLTGTSRVGVLEWRFEPGDSPFAVVQATREGFRGGIAIDPERGEITGFNPERQDAHLGPEQAASFRGWFVARFEVDAGTAPFASWGTANGATLDEGSLEAAGDHLSAYVRFPERTRRVFARVGTSLVSAAQARANLDAEVPDGRAFDDTVDELHRAWAARLDRVRVQGAAPEDRASLATALFHALQYPSRVDEGGLRYDGYLDVVREAPRPEYTSFSLWDTFRAQNALLILLAPGEVADMTASLLRTFESSGRLPIWENLVETNIMVGTHAQSLLAEAQVKGIPMDVQAAARAALKDSEMPPDEDTERWWGDREPDRLQAARPGLTRYLELGWVAGDETAEAGSRTLDYANGDRAASVLCRAAGMGEDAERLEARADSWRHLWNAERGFIQTRAADGGWLAGGWTEGTKWPYLFQVLHDIPGLRDLMGDELFIDRLDEHFAGGWNRHDNEPSHHIPFLYSYAGLPHRTAEVVRRIARDSYRATPDGLCGNDDLGQMSAWLVFAAMGFYPVDPVSGEYVVAAPLFEHLEVDLPGAARPLTIDAHGASQHPFVAGLAIDGRPVDRPFIRHADIARGAAVKFTMSAVPTAWGTGAV
ncbi:GH92 family glycosyl hydrolase [Microbacterium sp. NPDC019599]|uniref:GH92 family glycosyl hydrolase n=1 Tax=Microbacterium sp. NPDC019599 TaxID=3154690 RepID=UPI003401D0BA